MTPAGPIRLVEVGPRDGLQNEKASIPLDAKVALIDALSQTGVGEIEAGAFVSPKYVPQMADSEKVFERIKRKRNVIYSALVPNEEGLTRALRAKVDKISIFTAASETFNQKNINASIEASLERFRPVVAQTRAAKLPVRAYVSTAFHCPYEGPIKPRAVVAVVERLLELGVEELSIGDTIGRASPRDVGALLEVLLKTVAKKHVFLHFHDTYGMAVANALTAWKEYGLTNFDSSAGGLGGCPYAPGAGGNVATEDLAFALQAEGAKTGLDVAKVVAAAQGVAAYLGHPLNSRLSRVDLSRIG